jgi:peptide/nickel transport system permease protein
VLAHVAAGLQGQLRHAQLVLAVELGQVTSSTLSNCEDYVRTAWAKGLAGRIVVYKHALKNALIPVVTIVGGQLGTLLAGTVVIETIFALPGMGRLTVEAILFRDYPVVQTNVMLVAATLVTLNLIVDLTYAWLDPRIRYA